MVWYEEEVKRVENIKNTLQYQPKTIFYGSSSIRLWTTLYEDFKEFQPVNLGFGGSTLEACVYFFDRIMQPYQKYNPDHMVVYAGDNDLGDGKNADQVFASFKVLLNKVQQCFPGMQFTYISIKPSISRRSIIGNIRRANQLIQEHLDTCGPGYFFVDIFDKMLDASGNPVPGLFDADGLHLSPAGYTVWKDVLLTHISLNVEGSLTRL